MCVRRDLEGMETDLSFLTDNMLPELNPDNGGPMTQMEFERLCSYESQATTALSHLRESEKPNEVWFGRFEDAYQKALVLIKPYYPDDEPRRDE